MSRNFDALGVGEGQHGRERHGCVWGRATGGGEQVHRALCRQGGLCPGVLAAGRPPAREDRPARVGPRFTYSLRARAHGPLWHFARYRAPRHQRARGRGISRPGARLGHLCLGARSLASRRRAVPLVWRVPPRAGQRLCDPRPREARDPRSRRRCRAPAHTAGQSGALPAARSHCRRQAGHLPGGLGEPGGVPGPGRCGLLV